MDNTDENNVTIVDSGKPLKVNSTQLSLHPTIAGNKNFHFNEKTYQLNFSQKVLAAISKSIVIPVLLRRSNKKIKDYFVVGNIAEFAILEAGGFETMYISVLDAEPSENELIIANLFQPLIIRKDSVSAMFLAAKQENIYQQLEIMGEDLGFFVSSGRKNFPELNGYSKQGAHKTAASLELSENEIKFLDCLKLDLKVKEVINKETIDEPKEALETND